MNYLMGNHIFCVLYWLSMALRWFIRWNNQMAPKIHSYIITTVQFEIICLLRIVCVYECTRVRNFKCKSKVVLLSIILLYIWFAFQYPSQTTNWFFLHIWETKTKCFHFQLIWTVDRLLLKQKKIQWMKMG